MPGGPQPMERAERMALVQEIADRALAVYQEQVLAIGVYGSTARRMDGPFSDIEMFCVLNNDNENYCYEWSHGAWKAEVDIISTNVLLKKAAEIDERWPLTHGSFCNVQVLYDPTDFFTKLCRIATSQPRERFIAAIRALIVGEIYEAIGKLRNAQHQGNMAFLPTITLEMAKYGAFLIGLAHQHCYSTGSRVLEESLSLPEHPAGYAVLCQMVMRGELGDSKQIIDVCEAFWSGVEAWATMQGISIDESRRIPF